MLADLRAERDYAVDVVTAHRMACGECHRNSSEGCPEGRNLRERVWDLDAELERRALAVGDDR